MAATSIEKIASLVFALAIVHTFLTSAFRKIAAKYAQGSALEKSFHLLGEVEFVFGFWAIILMAIMAVVKGPIESTAYAKGLSFTEPLFIFVIMTISATRHVIHFARLIILKAARSLPSNTEFSIFFSCLVIGPLLGSLITEPAAMTVTALILRDRYLKLNVSTKFRYATLAVLFVNVSIGGVLTQFAAPPVLMVAEKWGWGFSFMLRTFGWRALIAVVINATCASLLLRPELIQMDPKTTLIVNRSPWWLTVIHIFFLCLVVAGAHQPVLFVGAFLLFLGVASITKEFQDELLLKQGLRVAFFLAGLVVLGGLQAWWLQPLLTAVSDKVLFLGTAALTSITDNAAITYLASTLEHVTPSFQYAIVSGAIAGGGLTVIANAPNPAGFSILQDTFGPNGIRPFKLVIAAALPTAIALFAFGLFSV